MGIEIESLRLFFIARALGADFADTLTIGRQDLLTTPAQLRAIYGEFGIPVSDADAERIVTGRGQFGEAALEAIGARTVDSLDASPFEGATVIHDLNDPLRPELAERYSLVFDGGTLEHVFDTPRALRTLMTLTRVGGHLLINTPANNEMGHGFYQFSPELFFRALSPANGFEVQAMFVVTPFSDAPWLKVRDPAAAGTRVGHNGGGRSAYLYIIARRTAAVSLFARPPQQSDYAAEWAEQPAKEHDPDRIGFYTADGGGVRALVRKHLWPLAPRAMQSLAHAARVGKRALQKPDPALFTPFRPDAASAARLAAALTP